MSNLCLGSQYQNIKLTISLQDQLVDAVLATISGVFSELRGGPKYMFFKSPDTI
jgi:hypothetical protein